MKLASVAYICISIALSGCAADNRSGAPVAEQIAYNRLETLTYTWEGRRVEVSFHRQARDGAWLMAVRDSWAILDQSLDGQARVWDQSASRCSKEECLQMIDQSLRTFQAEKPGARLASLDIDMHVVRDLWRELLAGLQQRLSTMDGTKSQSQLDIPDEIYNETQLVLDKSPTVAAIKKLLATHGLNARALYISDKITFNRSLAGRKWSDIATLPAVGVSIPGTFQFDLAGSQLATTTTSAKGSVEK